MANKPPAFQFYAKDWRSSPNVRRMNLKEEGLYIRLCALAWDSDSPGTITLSETEVCHEVRVLASSLRRFLDKFPSCWRREGETIVQPKLHEQWIEMKEFKENKSLAGQKGNAVRWHSDRPASASAFASASALKPKEEKPFNLTQTLSILGKEKSLPKLTPSESELFESDKEIEAIKQRQRKALQDKLGIAL